MPPGLRVSTDDLIPVRAAAPQTALTVRRPWLFADAMAVSTATATFAGVVLGLLAAADLVPGQRWSGAVQAHRDIQLFAWASAYVSALAFEFVVRLNQSTALPVAPRVAALGLLIGGALVQGVGQLFGSEVGWLWLPGAVSTTAGALLVAVLIGRVKPGFAPGSWFHSLWLRSATGWLVLSAGAGILAAMRGTQGVAHVEDSQFVAEAFIRGFLASAIVGIALRAFAGHLGLPPVGRPAQATAMIGINLASAGWLAGSGAFGMTQIAALQRASDLLFAASLLYITYSLGVLRAFQFDWKLPRYTLLLPWAWAGAVVYAVALGVAALSPGWDGRTLYETGALRHLFLLGFMAPLMVAMAHIVLARFGTGELLAPRPLLAAFLLLQSAWPLRVIPPLVSDPPNEVARTVMAVAGALTAAGLLFLAVAAIRTGRALRRRDRWSALPSLLSQT